MKKLLLFFGLFCMINLTFAQKMVTIHQNGHDLQTNETRSGEGHLRWGEFNPTVPQDSIRFWTGTGSNRAVVAITWNDAIAGNIGVAWGVQWSGTNVSIRMIMDTIAAYDSRLTVSGNAAVANLIYVDNELGLNLVGPNYYWWYNWKAADGSSYSSESAAADMLTNGDFVDWLPMDPDDFTTSIADLMIYASDPNGGTSTDPVDASLPFNDILYWVGTGSNSAEFIVNFAQPDTAFAWGFHFDGTTTAQAMVDAIAAADPRFWTDGTPSYNGDIHFVLDNGDTLGLSPVDPAMGYNFWWTNLNGVSADAGSASTIHNGDVFKYGDMNSAIGWDPLGSYFLQEAWVKTPTPVTPPAGPTPVEATIAFSDILFWVGEGSNEAVMAVNWADTALAWGYRWNGTKTVSDMLADIATADPRFSYELGTWGLDDILFAIAEGDTLRKVASSYWESKNNGIIDMGMSQTLANGDFEKWAEPAAGIVVDSIYYDGWGWSYSYVYPMTIYPVSVPVIDTVPVVPVEATIAFSEILFWVGEGSNEAVMAVNWADTALAWGYRWNGTATVADMMDHIAAADPRFSYTGTGMVSDINYIDTAAGMTTPLGITPGNYWGSTNNGVMDWGMSQSLNNGDFEKWADSGTGILVDSVWVDEYGGYWNYIYVYPMTITPVTVPDTTGGSGPDTIPTVGPFCGGVGTDGCNAIAANDNQFVAWATAAVITRGPQMITNPTGLFASFGGDTNAIGPATLNNSYDAVSLGDGGSALLTFERPIRNGEGPDFVVFENDNIGTFLELAFVEVSSDGVHFVRFPATSLTPTDEQVGSFGSVDPTFINNLAGKFKIGYGTPFDLEELADSANINIDSIVYVRVIDVIGTIDPQYASYDAFGHIVNDPWPTNFASSGFDLSGVGVIHQKPVGIENHEMPQVFAYPNPCNGTLYIINENAENVALYDMNGRLLQVVENGDTHITLNMQSYPAGLYMLKVGNGVQKILKK